MGPCVVFGEDVSVERVIFNGHPEMAHIHGNDVPDVGRGLCSPRMRGAERRAHRRRMRPDQQEGGEEG